LNDSSRVADHILQGSDGLVSRNFIIFHEQLRLLASLLREDDVVPVLEIVGEVIRIIGVH